MKKLLLLLLLVLLPSVSYGQYWGDRAAEKSFEQSGLYFNSHFLNPYGLSRLQDVAVGIIDDPFLALQLNPANLPHLKNGNSLFYFDFRGDRTEPSIIQAYYATPYLDLGWYPNPRWTTKARPEPEPIFSVGFLAYPFRKGLQELFVGATYQVIYKEERFYQVPNWIFYPSREYDAFGDKAFPEGQNAPVEDRYYGKDELSTQAHLVSAFAGYPLTADLDFGLGINTVKQTREGGYINSRSDQYSGATNQDYRYYREESRSQDYHHFDLNGGLSWSVSRDLTLGGKIGRLNGEVCQSYEVVDSSRHFWGDTLASPNWNRHQYKSVNQQQWQHDGHTNYARISFAHRLKKGKQLSGYYRYAKTDLELTNTAVISASSDYSSQWFSSYDTTTRRYQGNHSTSDIRNGLGNRSEANHQVMLNLKWKINRQSHLSLGAYFQRNRTEVQTDEPVAVDNWSENKRWENQTEYADYSRTLIEQKQLAWQYDATYWTIQIPVFLEHRFDRHFSLNLAVNRILERWETEEQTIISYDRHDETLNGESVDFEMTSKRDRPPVGKYTEDYTAILAGFTVAVSSQFKVKLLLDPETEHDFKINQWWLSFTLAM